MEPSAEMWYMVASAYSDAEYLYQAKLCFQEAYRIDPNYADIAEKLSVLSLMHNEIDDFFKYNNESEHPISEDIILEPVIPPQPNGRRRTDAERSMGTHEERERKQLIILINFSPKTHGISSFYPVVSGTPELLDNHFINDYRKSPSSPSRRK